MFTKGSDGFLFRSFGTKFADMAPTTASPPLPCELDVLMAAIVDEGHNNHPMQDRRTHEMELTTSESSQNVVDTDLTHLPSYEEAIEEVRPFTCPKLTPSHFIDNYHLPHNNPPPQSRHTPRSRPPPRLQTHNLTTRPHQLHLQNFLQQHAAPPT